MNHSQKMAIKVKRETMDSQNKETKEELPLQKTIDKCPECGDPAITRREAQDCRHASCPLK